MNFDRQGFNLYNLLNFKRGHPFKGRKVYFATKHGKEEILAPLFLEIGMKCVPGYVDTDAFGTFSGEVQREGSVKQTLRKKIQAAAEKYPDAEFIVASEGIFGPDPKTGHPLTNLETLLFWQRSSKMEIYVESLSMNPMWAEVSLGPEDDVRPFLREIGFSDQAVIVHPEGLTFPIFKGLMNEQAVQFAIRDSLRFSNANRVVIATDLRSSFNPTRRKSIMEAGKMLLMELKSLCPECAFPGIQATTCLRCKADPQEANQVPSYFQNVNMR